jgi:hypothetical protein
MTKGVYGSGEYVVKYHPKEYHQTYYKKNRERILKYGKQYYQDHKDKLKLAQKKRYEAQREEIKILNNDVALSKKLYTIRDDIQGIIDELEKKRSPCPEEPTA